MLLKDEVGSVMTQQDKEPILVMACRGIYLAWCRAGMAVFPVSW